MSEAIFRAHPQVAKCKRNLENVEKQMMIDVVARVECCKRQPGKDRRETAVPQTLPEHSAPPDVVITVKVAAANRVTGKLQAPEDETDDHRGGE